MHNLHIENESQRVKNKFNTALSANTHNNIEIPVMTGKSIVTSFVISIIITVSDIVNRETPAKNDAAPIRAIAPGSIHE